MAELIPDDMYEKIFLLMDLRDLIRFKSVCKSWKSFISGPRFVKAHLNHRYNKNENGHKRVGEAVFWVHVLRKECLLLGSSNGLVCVHNDDFGLLVGNPSTREGRTLPKPHTTPNRWSSCWGFGYDSLTDDYKVVKGDTSDKGKTCFQVFSLKSNAWNIIGEVNYMCHEAYCGVLCNGAIHWEMFSGNNIKKQVILSFHLSKEEFNEIPQPDVEQCKFSMSSLGLMEECLCIYGNKKEWVMKKYNDKQSWETLPDNFQIKFQVEDRFLGENYDTLNTHWFIGNRRFDGVPTIVESLVSPHLQAEND